MIMKKHILVLLSVLICSVSVAMVEAKTAATPEVNQAIKMYKAKNYAQSYKTLKLVTEKDPSNALAYYYLAMSAAQIGKRDEAIDNYTKVLSLTQHGQLNKYAEKGRTCLQFPERCHEDPAEQLDELERFIKRPYGSGFSDEVRSDYEKQKIENLMREMNRGKEVAPQKFKDYKDFSSEVPTNDEIVAALRVLQRAGLENMVLGNNNISELSMLTGNQDINNNEMLLNMLTGRNNSSSLSPQVIQSLLTNQMSIGF